MLRAALLLHPSLQLLAGVVAPYQSAEVLGGDAAPLLLGGDAALLLLGGVAAPQPLGGVAALSLP